MDKRATFACVGYGSLVNPNTLAAEVESIPGRLQGYRREWRIAGPTPSGGACTLTLTPEEGQTVLGVILVHPVHHLADLDKREWRYDRHVVDPAKFNAEQGTTPEDLFVYRAKREHYRWGDTDHPILQSYIDVVLIGFHHRWGVAGMRHFIETTDGWDTPIHNDRDTPRYKRANDTITQDHRALVDDVMHDAGLL